MNIEELNTELSERIQALRAISREPEARQSSLELTNFVDQVINQYPLTANAVSITVRPDAMKKSRNLYNARAYEGIRESGSPGTYVLHLPFRFSTGTHGSGERRCLAISCQTLTFQKGMDHTMATFDLSRGYLMANERVYAPIETIEKIELKKIKDSEYSPVFNAIKDALEPTYSYLTHYLNFRGYSARHGPIDCLKKEMDWQDSHEKIFKGILFPDRQSSELVYDRESGFVNGRCVMLLPAPALIEFNKFPMKREIYESEVECACAAIAIANRDPRLNWVFGEEKVIANLHAHKTERQI